MSLNEKTTKIEQLSWNTVVAYHDKRPRLQLSGSSWVRESDSNKTMQTNASWTCDICGVQFDEDPGAWCQDCVIGFPR